jgi:hypothetical protein
MALYWKAVGVYAGHLARSLTLRVVRGNIDRISDPSITGCGA